MSDVWTILRLFPENGLDRSLHVPVFLGLILLSFFRETLGWSFAGLVVPGYLATVLVAAPVTGALVVGEATLAYLLALLLGRVLPRAGFGFTFFGRERFLLIIACGSFVRLAVEASLVPLLVARWGLTHSRELYSLGLVLVPLLANSFWNAGFVRAFPRVALVTGLTYALVAEVLLPYTNFTLSRFQVANESVSLAFLESPHAHIVLLTGAIIAARNNVRYGWDYNGILVPALLAVAWYEPTKVATTLCEAVLVYLLSRALSELPPFSKMMLVGSRRVLLTFSVGFCLKFLLGMALFRWFPHIELLDFFGFGYLLPSLLANKMWDRRTIAGVLMPTLQVSLLAFPLGTLIGFGLRTFEVQGDAAVALEAKVTSAPSVASALMMGDLAPAPDRSGSDSRFVDAYQVAHTIVGKPFEKPPNARLQHQLAARSGLRTERDASGDWTILTPSSSNSNSDPTGPRVAVRTSKRYGDRWLIMVDAPTPASPSIALAFALGIRLGARAIVVRSRFPAIAQRDEKLALQLIDSLALDRVLTLSLREHEGPAALRAVGALPRGISTGLVSELLGIPVRLQFRSLGSTDTAFDRSVQLHLTRAQAETAASHLAPGPEVAHWHLETYRQAAEKLRRLTRTDPSKFRVPSTRELRLYGHLLNLRRSQPGRPSPWQRALAAKLDLQFAQTTGQWQGWALYEPLHLQRRGLPTVLQRNRTSSGSNLAVTLAAPRWQRGGIVAALRITEAFEAEQLLIHGTLVNAAADGSSDPRQPQGRKLWFQRAHETWLEQGGFSIVLRALPQDRVGEHSLVASFDTDVTTVNHGPHWTRPLVRSFSQAGLSIAAVDGTATRAGLTASRDPAVAYARRFAPNRLMVLWLAPALRDAWSHARTTPAVQRHLTRSELPIWKGSPQQLLSTMQRCQRENSKLGSCTPFVPKPRCHAELTHKLWDSYTATRNPFFLDDALRQANHCGWAASRAPHSETTWLIGPSTSIRQSSSLSIRPLIHGELGLEKQFQSLLPSREVDRILALALSPLKVGEP